MTQFETSNAAPKHGAFAWKSATRALFLVATIIAASAVLAQEWDGLTAALSAAHLCLLALALGAAAINVIFAGLSWRALLWDAPVQLSVRQSAQIFFLGQIGKYLPGTVWSFLASAELAKQAGFARTTAVSSLLLALAIGSGTGAILALSVLPDALSIIELNGYVVAAALLTPVLLAWPPIKTWLLQKAKIDFPVSGKSLLLSCATALAGWFFAGAQIAAIAQAIGTQAGWLFLIQATGIYALAWIAGLLFFIAPAGLGVREGVLVALLAAHMPLTDALVVALLSRLSITFADFLLAGISALICRDEA